MILGMIPQLGIMANFLKSNVSILKNENVQPLWVLTF
jgi:hypothetical protein